jgi:hypothetical protein
MDNCDFPSAGSCTCNKYLRAQLMVRNTEFVGTFLTPLRMTIVADQDKEYLV